MILQLTEEQANAIEPAMARVRAMAAAGTPGMCVAQVYSDHMRVGVFSHEAASKIIAALGSPSRTHRTAFELLPEAANAPDGNGPACNVMRPWEEPPR